MRYPTYSFQGQQRTLAEIGRRTGVSPKALRGRIVKQGMTLEEAIAIPTAKSRTFTFDGKTRTISQWAKETGINSATLRERIGQFGWTLERALTEPVMDMVQRNRRKRNMRIVQRIVSNVRRERNEEIIRRMLKGLGPLGHPCREHSI
ncbi:hypothetical protein ABFT80_23960 [Mesorhizobium sp. SB112]|uniref:hypothetical protein n=1 Tax=Mesorhizobium sp. SB112 TaxID=3151853 RepID=UPI003265C58D